MHSETKRKAVKSFSVVLYILFMPAKPREIFNPIVFRREGKKSTHLKRTRLVL